MCVRGALQIIQRVLNVDESLYVEWGLGFRGLGFRSLRFREQARHSKERYEHSVQSPFDRHIDYPKGPRTRIIGSL